MFDWNQDISDDTNQVSEPLDPFLCYPELMTKNQLIKLLKERHLNLPKDETTNGYEYYNLIDLYNRVLLPFPQRIYDKNNRKSKELQSKQNECNKRPQNKRKLEDMIKNDDNCTQHKTNNNIKYETNSKQIINQTTETKRHKISWP